jgi:hypothetical protein
LAFLCNGFSRVLSERPGVGCLVQTATLSGALIGIGENAKTHAWIAGADSTKIEGMFFVKHH